LSLNRVICEFNAGEQLPRAAIGESMSLFCAEVMPRFV
jgi:hypothetical protein